jgi:DHA2 family multidrug resistance protein
MPADAAQRSRFDCAWLRLSRRRHRCLAIMLDRGEQHDWFASLEIQLELAIAFLGFYLYWVHWRGTERPFLDLGLLRDRNFLAGGVSSS